MTASDRPWDGSSSRFTIEQWRRSCLIDRGGDSNNKDNYSLPVREPGGSVNRRAVHNAAARLSQVQGVSGDKIAAAARALIRLYGELGETPPDSLKELAGSRSLAGDVEYRTTPLAVECRSSSDQRRIGGLAAVFGRRSQLLGNFYEELDPQFFDESHSQGWPNVICRAEHDSRMLLGAIHSGTLQLAVDHRGLDYTCSLPASRQDTWESVSRGDYAGSSFAFHCTDDDWDYRDGTPLRVLRAGVLHDVGPVTVPAYRDTSAALRSLARRMDAPLEDVEMYSRGGELRRFFVRSDWPTPRRRTMSGAQALMHIMGMRWPEWYFQSRRPLSGAQARMYLLGKRPYDPIATRAQRLSTLPARAARDPRQAKLLLHAHRIAGGW
ncbi:MAG: HK97 family phage prohead protease [Mycobacterium sp.]